jgi:hypothetical protein
MVVETDGVTPIIPAENVADCAKKRAANMHQMVAPNFNGYFCRSDRPAHATVGRGSATCARMTGIGLVSLPRRIPPLFGGNVPLEATTSLTCALCELGLARLR